MNPNRITRTAARGIAETRWFYNPSGTVTLSFHNLLTDAHEYRTYRTESAAKAAETKFHNRISRIYDSMYT